MRTSVTTRVRTHVGVLVHGGAGSWTRLHALLRHLRADVTVLSHPTPGRTLPDDVAHVALPLPESGDTPLVTGAGNGPLGAAATARLSTWLEEQRPDLLVVDGLADAVLVGRIAGVPVVSMRCFSGRGGPDGADLGRAATAWIAPYPAVLEPLDTPAEIRLRTVHTGFLSRFEGRRASRSATRRRLGIDRDARHATIVLGVEGSGITRREVRALAAVARTWSFTVAGPCPESDQRSAPSSDERVRFVGWTDDLFPYLSAADVVVCDASLGIVADVATAIRPFAVVTRQQEGDASVRLGDALEDAGIASVFDRWPDALAWPALLAELLDHDTRTLRRVVEGRAARRAAEWVDGWALTPPPHGVAGPASDERARVAAPAAPRGASSPLDGRTTGIAAAAER